MESQNRKTASAYINNLLLSRGLLRNGIAIEFATPEQAKGGLDGTMSEVMNLVHDLILRRDRESDHLANISQNLQTARATAAQHAQNVSRLELRNSDLDRKLALTGAQERSARATLSSAETRNRALREEMTRLKGTVAQIRAQCATDVRRRDGEIQRLKRHLEDRRGRNGNGGQVGVVVVTPGINRGAQSSRNGEAVVDLESPAYSLKQETTEFLTQLSQGLSDENDALIGLVKGTLATLRSLQGLPADGAPGSETNADMDINGNANGLMTVPPAYEDLASDTDEVLEQLRGLLTNPSYVTVEEVEIREEEIHRLRQGWEKMAARWKEAVALMDGWKKRMVDSGDTINLDDLKMGIDLGAEIPTVQAAHEGSLLKIEEEADADESDIVLELDDCLEGPSSPEPNAIESPPKKVQKLFATDRALSPRDANAVLVPSPRKASFPPIKEENTKAIKEAEDGLSVDIWTSKDSSQSPPKVKSRIPRQKDRQQSLELPTIQQKLERAEKEADDVRNHEEGKPRESNVSKQAVKRKLKGSRRSTLSPEELESLMGLA